MSFFQAVFLVRHGVGSWREVRALAPFDRICLYYAIQQQEGMHVDWTTGAITQPPPQTLRG